MNSNDLHQIFFVECEEALAAAEDGLNACRSGTEDADTVNAIFRAVHSIKGGAGAFGFTPLQAFTHIFETLLSDVREGIVPLEKPLVELLLGALDVVSDHVAAARSGEQAPDDKAMALQLEAAQASNATPAPAPAPAPTPEPVPAPVSACEAEDDFNLDALLDGLTDAAPIEPSAQAGVSGQWLLHMRPHSGALANGGEPLLLLRELAALGGACIECDLSALPGLDLLDPEEGYLGWTFALPVSVAEDEANEIFDFIGDDCSLAYGESCAIPPMRPRTPADLADPVVAIPTQTPAAGPAPVSATVPAAVPANGTTTGPTPVEKSAASTAPAAQSVRIDLVKLDKLIDGVGELVIAQAMLAQRLSEAKLSHVEELAMLETLVRDIQESAMAFRAQPIDAVFARVPRLLRELATSTGKRVRLEVQGEGTELDKTVIERLGEPLTHLIRNAVDHGIEDEATRLAAGKPAEGVLSLSAEHRAGRIMIRIADDGLGINREKVLAKARDKGLVAPDATPTDEEIDNLIFAPGFSTAAEVSSISGRGVGMDVVRQNVKDLGGRITIESIPGKGTAFILALPLTLAISDGMIVQVGDQALVVPLAHVVESLRPAAADLKGMGSKRVMLNVRGHFIPVVPLDAALDRPGQVIDPRKGVLIVVETEHMGQAALLVDAITDQRQFVIKSLDKHYCHVDGVAGATILGDGRVALILDVDRLVASASTRTPTLEAA